MSTSLGGDGDAGRDPSRPASPGNEAEHPAHIRIWQAAPQRRGVRGWTLAALLALVALNAGYGGAGLIRDGMDMPADWAQRLPFGSCAFAGIALLVTVGLPQLLSCVLVLRGHRRAALAGAIAGLALIAWIAVQLLIMRRYFFLQPVIAGLGLAELLLAVGWLRSALPPGRHRA